LPDLEREAGVPVLGVIEPGAGQAVARTRCGKIGVIGTRATVRSSAYTRAIHGLNPDLDVLAQPCPLFVPLAEEGWTDNQVARETAEIYLRPLLDAGVDTLVLGCTHYPLLKGIIAEVAGDRVALVDSAEAVSVAVREQLKTTKKLLASRDDAVPRHRFFVTDAPEPFHDAAKRFLGRSLDHLELVEIAGE
jgi:glutamate racemase